jgi:hypothetical protein
MKLNSPTLEVDLDIRELEFEHIKSIMEGMRNMSTTYKSSYADIGCAFIKT